MLVEKIPHDANDTVFVYTTCGSKEEARSLGLSCVEQKLAISADFWVIDSIYPWHYVIQEVEQYMLMLTTVKNKSDQLMKAIGIMHSYTTPMITRLDTAIINPSYTFWMQNTLEGKKEYISEHDEEMKQQWNDEKGYHFGRFK